MQITNTVKINNTLYQNCYNNTNIFKIDFDNLPFGTLNLCPSFSHDANVACNASVIFLLVPGVRGGGTNCPLALAFVLFVFDAVGVWSIIKNTYINYAYINT